MPRGEHDSRHQWQFFRAGGFDQAQLESGDDLLALENLDQKLWVALACPVDLVELDRRTLELIDTDGDGIIRAPEILSAVEWARQRLKCLDLLVEGKAFLNLDDIDDSTAEGRRLLESAKMILQHTGKSGSRQISVEEASDTAAIFAGTRFNGDGVITSRSTDDPFLHSWIADIASTLGSKEDRSGEEGIDAEIVETFNDHANNWLAWHESPPKGQVFHVAMNPEQCLLWNTLRPKIDDYFIRCRLASYDERAALLLNPSEETLLSLAALNLAEAEESLSLLPLAAVGPGVPLDLRERTNPAWTAHLQQFVDSVVRPLLGDIPHLTPSSWEAIKKEYSEWEAWWEQKVDTPVANLGPERLRQWDSTVCDSLRELLVQDSIQQEAFESIVEVEKTTRICRDLYILVNNFVSFRDFYTKRGKAIFQAGTLYLDGRSYDLCVRVKDVAKHAMLATFSRVYLAYCDCVRNGGADRMTIAAAVTNGDSDQLMAGRNGVFYDRAGRDWIATIVRVIDHPISIRQAFWAPYKRVAHMVSEQVQKMAAARSKAAEEKAAAALMQAGTKKEETKAQQLFDVGKYAGIFAAIGLALGAIGTALATVMTGFLKLSWWQMPLVILGIILLISGPSVLMAWFKLHQRNLGPILDGNGWAVNARAKLNIPFGASLTGMPVLPEGSKQSLSDPYAEKGTPWKTWALMVTILLAIAGWFLGWFSR